jgi:hypothetical protein
MSLTSAEPCTFSQALTIAQSNVSRPHGRMETSRTLLHYGNRDPSNHGILTCLNGSPQRTPKQVRNRFLPQHYNGFPYAYPPQVLLPAHRTANGAEVRLHVVMSAVISTVGGTSTSLLIYTLLWSILA